MPNPFFGLLPVTAGDGAAGREHRARAAAASLPAVRRGQHDDQRRQVVVPRAAGQPRSGGSRVATRSASNYTYSKFTEATEFLNAADPEPRKGISSLDAPHRLTVNGIWEVPVGRGRRFGHGRQRRGLGVHQRLAVLGDLHLPERLPDRLRQHHLHRRHRRHRAAGERADGGALVQHRCRLQQGLGAAARDRTSARSRCGSRTSAPTTSTTSICRSSRTRRWRAETIELRFDSLNAFNHPLFPGPNTNPTAVAFGTISASTQLNYARRTQVMVKFIF